MRMRSKVVLAVVWVVSLTAVGVIAQARPPAGSRSAYTAGADPKVLAGADIGFRIDHFKGDTPVGELVVKKDGKWVAVEFGARMKMVK